MVLNSQHTCISFFLHSFLCFFLYCLFIGDEYLLWCLIQFSHLTIPSAWIKGVNYHTWILHLFLVTFPLLLDSVSHYYVLRSPWTNVEPMCTVFTIYSHAHVYPGLHDCLAPALWFTKRLFQFRNSWLVSALPSYGIFTFSVKYFFEIKRRTWLKHHNIIANRPFQDESQKNATLFSPVVGILSYKLAKKII